MAPDYGDSALYLDNIGLADASVILRIEKCTVTITPEPSRRVAIH